MSDSEKLKKKSEATALILLGGNGNGSMLQTYPKSVEDTEKQIRGLQGHIVGLMGKEARLLNR